MNKLENYTDRCKIQEETHHNHKTQIHFKLCLKNKDKILIKSQIDLVRKLVNYKTNFNFHNKQNKK